MRKYNIRMPDREGWVIEWEKGTRTVTLRNGRTVERPIIDSFTSVSKEKVLQKKKEMETQGYKVTGPMECIF